ncbi:MAG: response regulator [Pseudorhodobacter sp.]|nr:response regulator [Pseudorhodobacter sp.]
MLRLAETDQEATWLRNRSRAAMLMRVAHDLRTPIQALLASADALSKNPATSPQADDGARTRRAAELALDHISNVLAVIRGEQNQKGGQPDEDFQIADEVGSLVAMMEPVARARATEISLTLDVPADLTLIGPLRFVRALCQNLLDNSVNHGGGRVDLRLTCAPTAASLPGEGAIGEIWRVSLELKDEGGGLPAVQRARLGEALGLAPEDVAPTSGIASRRPSAGLDVMVHALRQLGGKITISDRGSDGTAIKPGIQSRVIGTVFNVAFSLPRAPSMISTLPTDHLSEHSPLSGRTILVVEDSPSSRDWLTHVLQTAGAQVHPVGSGAEALARLSRDECAARVELVLTDVTLPRMNGIELATHLLAGDPASAVRWRGKVVGLTAHADDRIRASCLKAGMVCVLEKPIQPRTLIRNLSEILQGVALKQLPDAAAPLLGDVLNVKALAGLIEQLGIANLRSFMHRALGEARSVLDELQKDGIGPDTGRRLHAATGACGLTGLHLVEKRLRALELGLAQDRAGIASLAEAAAQSLDATFLSIERLEA